MFTDNGPFSSPSAKQVGKDHGLCTQHARQDIPSATAGLGNSKEQAMRDLNALIFKYTSVSALEAAFEDCRCKYGHSAATSKMIESLNDIKQKLCRAYTQNLFSYNHTSTQRGESFNDTLKGHGHLKAQLSDASLPVLIDRLDAIALDKNNKALDVLTKVRQDDERVTPSYKTEVEKSLELSALTIKSCDKVDGSESQYISTRTNGDQFVVDLKTKIMHRGEIFVIPTCSCGYWRSCFRLCRDIVRALVISSELNRSVKVKDLIVVVNIHPFHLVQFHPIWRQAVRRTKRADYNDLPQINRILGGGNAEASASASIATPDNNGNGTACPDKFYTLKGRIPPLHKARIGKLNEVFKVTSELAVNKGNAETFQHCHARLLQCKKEITDMISSVTNGVLSITDQIPLPPQMRASNKTARSKADATNNSRLTVSSSTPATKSKRSAKKKPAVKQTANCSQCELLVTQTKLMISYNDHSIDQCPYEDLFVKYILKSEAGGTSKSEDGIQQGAV